METALKATNLRWHQARATREDRERILQQRGVVIWLTGLPASGKSTSAFELEYELVRGGYFAYVLDGDNIRHGLNKDLGFSPDDRTENIRRLAEVAKLFADAGIIVITSFISPYAREREFARQISNAADIGFVEVYVDTPVQVCEERDPKGLYKKARRGELSGFTGVDDPYEPPAHPEVVVQTAINTPLQVAAQIVKFLIDNGLIDADRVAQLTGAQEEPRE
jgi:adenylylsulfate kinase